MGKLDDIRKRLQAGSTTKQLIKQGYAKSSVFTVAKKLKWSQPDIPATPVPDELQELRRQKEIIKLQKEIVELEAAKGKLPKRITDLERQVVDLKTLINDTVDTCLFTSLVEAGWDRNRAWKYADGWVGRNIVK